jgi:hypothetical protein
LPTVMTNVHDFFIHVAAEVNVALLWVNLWRYNFCMSLMGMSPALKRIPIICITVIATDVEPC